MLASDWRTLGQQIGKRNERIVIASFVIGVAVIVAVWGATLWLG